LILWEGIVLSIGSTAEVELQSVPSCAAWLFKNCVEEEGAVEANREIRKRQCQRE
jgi:hypothetical protein